MAPGTFKCDLCEVICTGRDAFAAHIKGSSHTKVTLFICYVTIIYLFFAFNKFIQKIYFVVYFRFGLNYLFEN